MARPDPAGDHRDRAADHEQRLAALRARLHEAAGEIHTAQDWARCLQAAARLPGQSWANILLIASRIPDATMVKSYEAWQAAGRQVSRNEKGIEIFSCRDPTRVTYIWDLSQTTGQPLPARAETLASPGEAPPGLWDCLCWLARRKGFAVEREPGCPDNGTILQAARRIRILPGLASGQAVSALAHQLGHILLHHTSAALPGAAQPGCHGVQKAEADSVAFIICARYGIKAGHTFSSPQSWAGTDPRAQPAAAMLATGERITTAAAKIIRYLDDHLQGTTGPATVAAAPLPDADARIKDVLLDAEEFFIGRLSSSWVPAYLRTRGVTAEAAAEWHIGYGPSGWTTLTSYLRSRGHPDEALQAAGLARTSSRGTLIDHFRDRVMLPVYDEHGTLAGFIARARPGVGPDVPKYLNSPATSTYQKR